MNAQHIQATAVPTARVHHGLGRLAYRTLILMAIAANLAIGAYIVAVIVPGIVQLESGRWIAPVITPSPSPTQPVSIMAGIGVMMPSDADCAACHTGPGSTKPVPVMAHPIAGWTQCTECHATDRLVETAPGHSSLHKEDCLLCHTAAADQSPAPKPHHSFNGSTCTSCHGNPDIPQAPLPRDMAARDADACWVCHGLTETDELWTSTAAPVPGTNETPAPGEATTSGAAATPAAGTVPLYRLEP